MLVISSVQEHALTILGRFGSFIADLTAQIKSNHIMGLLLVWTLDSGSPCHLRYLG